MTHTNSPTRFSRPRFALLVLLGAYPTITAILYAVVPLTSGWTIWQRTLVVAPAMVAAMVWGVIPAVVAPFDNTDEMIQIMVYSAVAQKCAAIGSHIVLTAGIPFTFHGVTNMIKIHTVRAEDIRPAGA